jgi:diguanylate cyclase
VYEADGKDDISVLKSLLPVMSRHASGYHPISYTVWYEYNKGANRNLKQDIEAELQHVERLTPSQTYSVYVKHLIDPAERAVMSARSGLLGLVSEVKGKVRDVEIRTAGFDEELTRFQSGVASAKTLDELQGNVSTILAETRKVSESFSWITRQLDESRKEAQRLADELRAVREEAMSDALSGLFNRRGFDLELERLAFKAGEDGRLALILIDIDHFKNVNDTYGHPFGDAVIAGVGRFIQETVAAAGVAARYGGEEFAVLLPEHAHAGAAKFAEAIRARVEQGKIKRRKDDEAVGGITISAGVAAWRKGDSAAQLVERADAALYAAKHAGRNRVQLES